MKTPEDRLEYKRQYYQQNKAKAFEKHNKWVNANRDRVNEIARRSYYKRRDEKKAEQQALQDTLQALQKENRDLRNELCQRCGKYREAYLGACDGCRWKAV